MPLDRRALAVTVALALWAWSIGETAASTVATAPVMDLWPLPRLSPLDSVRLRTSGVSVAAVASKKTDKLAPLAEAKTALVAFTSSPFPYGGVIPEKQVPFLDAVDGNRRGHTSGRAGVYWEDETYRDRSVLLSFPTSFDLRKPAVIVVFFHGNQATLARDVMARQQVVDQLAASGLNAVLVAPQFAYDAIDSSAGNFWRPGFFARFLKETAARLAKLYGPGATAAAFDRLPVIFVAYSGGYDAAGYALAVGGATRRVHGLVLLDALYGEEDKFVDWIARYGKSAFFFSAYSLSSAAGNADAEESLKARRIDFRQSPPRHLAAGTITFLATDPAVVHDSFVTSAWVPLPLQWLLARVPGYPR